MNRQRNFFNHETKDGQKLNRYVQRIQQLLNKQKSRSPSPYNPRVKQKIISKGPMINRLHTYIKYEHSFTVLMKFIQTKCENLMKHFFSQVRIYQKPQNKQKIIKFIPVKDNRKNKVIIISQLNKKPKILILRLVNLIKNYKRDIFKQILNYIKQPQYAITINDNHDNHRFAKFMNIHLMLKNKQMNYQTQAFLKMKYFIQSNKKPIYANNKINGILRLINIQFNIKHTIVRHIRKYIRQKEDYFIKIKRIGLRLYEKNKQNINVVHFFKFLYYQYTQTKIKANILNIILQKLLQKRKLQSYSRLRQNQQKKIKLKNNSQKIIFCIIKICNNKLNNALNRIKYKKIYSQIKLYNLIQIIKSKINIQIFTVFESFKMQPKETIAKSQISNIKSRKMDKKKTLISSCYALGKLGNILNTKYSVLSNTFYSRLYFINQRCKKLQNSVKIIQKYQKQDSLKQLRFYVQNFTKDRRKQRRKKQICILITIIKIKIKKIMFDSLSKIKNEGKLKILKKCSKNGVLMSKILKKIYMKTIISSYLCLKNNSIKKQQKENKEGQQNKIFTDLIDFFKQRNQNLQKIRNNYSKLKSLVNLEDNVQIKQVHFQQNKAKILNLQQKLHNR